MTDPGSPTGTPETRLIVIRGNSGSGKSTIARRLQRGHGRGCALVEQDYLRRIVLRERDRPGGIAPALIDQTVRFALDHAEMRGWYAPRDLLGFDDEHVIPESSTLEATVAHIATTAGLHCWGVTRAARPSGR